MTKQIIISLIANAGGVGKTTIATHLAYGLGQKGISVALIDLDPQRALDVFCGLPPAHSDASIVQVLAKDFKGDWPLFPAWGHLNIEVCPGHPSMAQIADDLVIRRRGEYVLADRLRNHPLHHDVVIIDCPATLGKICENAVAASTHLLVPIQLEMKSISGVADLIQWKMAISSDLQLQPPPEVLGVVPSLYSQSKAIHRMYLEQLPEVAAELDIPVYPAIRDSAEFKNCSANGLPLQMYRPNHAAVQDFEQMIADVAALVKPSAAAKSKSKSKVK
jgi:chromosome partitioning protein